MGAIYSYFFGKPPPKTPIDGFGTKIKNIFTIHYRGLIGGFLPLFVLLPLMEKGNNIRTVALMWVWMAWSFFWQPVNVPIAGLIPVFTLPLTCAMSTDLTAGCYMSEGIAMFIVSNTVLLLWNNCGLDRRLILWFLSSGDETQCSSGKLVIKCCTCGFFLSMMCNKLIVANILIQYITGIMNKLQLTSTKIREPNYDSMRAVLCSAIQSSCSIGGMVIIHASYTTLAFRSIFHVSVPKGMTWPDIFSYLDYTIFTFPTALVMLICNIIYHSFLMNMDVNKQGTMSAISKRKFRIAVMTYKKEIPSRITLHEKLALLFSVLAYALWFTRQTRYMTGWCTTGVVRDCAVAALFSILLHALPCGFRFLKIWGANKKSEIGALKPESGILWWRFVDKNVTWGYLFTIGSGAAISISCRNTGLSIYLRDSVLGSILHGQNNIVYYLFICVIAVFLANIMSSVAAVNIFLPFVINMYLPTTRRNTPSQDELTERMYLGALAVGLAGSCSFMFPFLYTAGYFCHYTGKIKKRQMATYGVGSAVICAVILWLAITFYAPLHFGPPSKNNYRQYVPLGITTLPPKTGAGEATPPPTDDAGGGGDEGGGEGEGL